jgi:hypothetical protein
MSSIVRASGSMSLTAASPNSAAKRASMSSEPAAVACAEVDDPTSDDAAWGWSGAPAGAPTPTVVTGSPSCGSDALGATGSGVPNCSASSSSIESSPGIPRSRIFATSPGPGCLSSTPPADDSITAGSDGASEVCGKAAPDDRSASQDGSSMTPGSFTGATTVASGIHDRSVTGGDSAASLASVSRTSMVGGVTLASRSPGFSPPTSCVPMSGNVGSSSGGTSVSTMSPVNVPGPVRSCWGSVAQSPDMATPRWSTADESLACDSWTSASRWLTSSHSCEVDWAVDWTSVSRPRTSLHRSDDGANQLVSSSPCACSCGCGFSVVMSGFHPRNAHVGSTARCATMAYAGGTLAWTALFSVQLPPLSSGDLRAR